MSLLDQAYGSGARVAWSITRKLRSAYAGNAIRIFRKNSSAGPDDNTLDIGFDGNGDLDTTAIANFCTDGQGYIDRIYDQSGNGHDLTFDAGFTGGVQIYGSGAVFADSNNIPYADIISATLSMETGDSLGSLATFSMFLRVMPDGDIDYGVASEAGDTGGKYLMHVADGSSGTGINSNVGTPSIYKGGTQFSGSTKDDIHTFLADTEFDNWSIVNGDFSETSALVNFRLFYGRFVAFSAQFQEVIVYPSDKSADRSNIESELSTYYEPVAQPIAGTIEYPAGTPLQNAIVKIFTEATLEDQAAPTFVETVLTDANGDFAMATAYDETKYYKAEYRKFIPKYTGTIDSATASSFTDAGAFTANEFDDGQAIVRMTGGVADGDEREIDGNADTDTCDIDGTWSTNPSAGDPYEVGYMYSDELKFKPPRA